MAKVSKYKKVSAFQSAEKEVSGAYPSKIVICSDGNELDFVESRKIDSKLMVYYAYSKSETKMGLTLPMPAEQLESMLRKEICKPI